MSPAAAMLSKSECHRCNEVLTTPLACGSCESIFEVSENLSPFQVFGLQVAARLDHNQLRKRLLELQKLLHPDFHGAAGAVLQDVAEHNTAEVNRAYELLGDDARRSSWLVEHLGGPAEGKERQMPQAFLMEVMEWNEALERMRATGPKPTAEESEALDDLEAELNIQRAAQVEEVLDLMAEVLAALPGAGAPTTDPLVTARRTLNAVRYLDRALDEVRSIRLDRS